MTSLKYRLQVFFFGVFVAILGLIDPNKAMEMVLKSVEIKDE